MVASPQSWARRAPAPGLKLLLRLRIPGEERGTEETGGGGRWSAGEEVRAPGAQGSALPRESEGEGSRARHAPSLGPFSHISAGRGRISHALPCARRAAAALPGLVAPRPAVRCPAPRRPAHSTSGKGGEEGTGPWGVGGAEQRGVFRLCPPLYKKQKQKRRPRSRPPSPRPHLAGPECGEFGCPVSCKACT